jgi:hypothetical protein
MSSKVSPAVGLEARLLRWPPLFFFLISAVFHYLGPAFAVVLFQRVTPLGVAWLRIATAALFFALFRKPWRVFLTLPRRDQRRLIGFGVVLAAMNSCFYLSISVLPLGTVGAIEFLGPIILAVSQFRTARNFVSLSLAVVGVYFLTRIEITNALAGYLFAFANCALFMLYVSIGPYDRLQRRHCRSRRHWLGHAYRHDHHHTDRDPRCCRRALQSGSFSRCRRSRYHLVGDPLRVRPTRDEEAASCKFLFAIVRPAGDGNVDGNHRPATIPFRASARGSGVSSRSRGATSAGTQLVSSHK